MGVSGSMFLLVPAYPGCPGSKAVKQSLLLLNGRCCHLSLSEVDLCSGCKIVLRRHTHTHARLTALCPGLPRWAGTRKVKPIWILLKQETVSGSGISWAICKSAHRSREITMPSPHRSVFLQAGCPSCCPTNSFKALKTKNCAQKTTTFIFLVTWVNFIVSVFKLVTNSQLRVYTVQLFDFQHFLQASGGQRIVIDTVGWSTFIPMLWLWNIGLKVFLCNRSRSERWYVELSIVQFVYEGVSFLNDEQENILRRHISGSDASNAMDRYLSWCWCLLFSFHL